MTNCRLIYGHLGQQDNDLTLLHRQRLSYNDPWRRNMGFSPHNIEKLRQTCRARHEGCVNTAKWSKDGHFLVTGSDDCHIKIWDVSQLPNAFTLRHDFDTCHSGSLQSNTFQASQNHTNIGNIFCAEISPWDNHTLLSCGADGYVVLNDLHRVEQETRLSQHSNIA